MRLSINASCQAIKKSSKETFNKIVCKFCFKSYPLDFDGEFCTLCKRRLTRPRRDVKKSKGKVKNNRNNSKPKVSENTALKVTKDNEKVKQSVDLKVETKMILNNENQAKKKKKKKEKNAGLCISGKSSTSTGKQEFGAKNDVPAKNGFPAKSDVTAATKVKQHSVLPSKKPHDKNKLKFLLNKKEEKRDSKLQDFLKLM